MVELCLYVGDAFFLNEYDLWALENEGYELSCPPFNSELTKDARRYIANTTERRSAEDAMAQKYQLVFRKSFKQTDNIVRDMYMLREKFDKVFSSDDRDEFKLEIHAK